MLWAALDRPSITSANEALDNSSATQGKFDSIENVGIFEQEVYTHVSAWPGSKLGAITFDSIAEDISVVSGAQEEVDFD